MQSTAQFLKANLNTQHLVGLSVTSSDWAVLVEDSGKTYIVELQDKQQKIKGLGVFNPFQVLNEVPVGGRVAIGQKEVVRGPPRLPELTKGMVRRAQTIGSKDAGFLVAKLGLGPSDVVLEAGIGSAGLSLHVQRVLGTTGTHITVEPRAEHSKAALENLRRASATWTSVPTHHHIEGRIEESIEAISALVDGFHAILLDLPDHPSAIEATVDLLVPGGRLACYCPSNLPDGAVLGSLRGSGFDRGVGRRTDGTRMGPSLQRGNAPGQRTVWPHGVFAGGPTVVITRPHEFYYHTEDT